MTVLVTGATGTVGRWCTEALGRQGHAVHALGGGGRADGVDLLDFDATRRLVERIRPTGDWETTYGAFWTSPASERWLEASRALVTAAVGAGARRAVIADTCAEYDWSADALGDGTCIDGVTPIRPATPYGSEGGAPRRVGVRSRASWRVGGVGSYLGLYGGLRDAVEGWRRRVSA